MDRIRLCGAEGARVSVERTFAAIGDDPLNAFVSLRRQDALAEEGALSADTPLGGLPVAVKDNLCMTGTRTTCASKLLESWVSPYDATAVARLRAAGGIVVGKTNMDEFAMGSSSEHSAFGPVLNPHDPTRVPGGSSGGSAAAVAAGWVPAALGSDTGGSVRQPGAFCGVTAIKPTYGRVSRYGLIAFASSLDQVGVFGVDAETCARVLQVISGFDDRDSTSAQVEVPNFAAAVSRGVAGKRVGVPRALLAQADVAVRDAVEETLQRWVAAGAQTVDIELPHAELGVSVYYLIATAEASSNLARFDGVRYGLRVEGASLEEMYEATRAMFGAEVKRRIILGTYALSSGYYDAYYLKASRVRTLLRADYTDAFKSCDVVLTPTAPTTAFELGAKSDPLAMYLCDLYTLPASLAGLPAINVPCGVHEGLPIGAHLVAPSFDESSLFAFAGALK